jgi:hypothetical protein
MVNMVVLQNTDDVHCGGVKVAPPSPDYHDVTDKVPTYRHRIILRSSTERTDGPTRWMMSVGFNARAYVKENFTTDDLHASKRSLLRSFPCHDLDTGPCFDRRSFNYLSY